MMIGDRIRFRRIMEEDWELRYRWGTDPDISATLQSGLGIPLSAAKAREQILSFLADPGSRADFVVLDKETEEPIGFVHLTGIDPWARRAELGILIGRKEYHGQGYGTEITRLIVRFGFERLNLHKVYLTVNADNPAGIRCYEKAGFRRDGVLRDEIYKNGVYLDRILMSILKHEFHSAE
ncbi:GNAT family N-acetyltransferase [Paenibacillus mucilaginosus]|nr:GNAT family protein [Paenibacillus mucilaginosus]MCG7217501.1 GNAT family N-acetyltransferase [Paenibacillus mucilaginosus]WDM30899.1 GNAT family N-acetyltransferase [Paenibacillus mucilaginosus]